jgi:mRNA interferase RelE/StbE
LFVSHKPKQFRLLPFNRGYERVRDVIRSLAQNPRLPSCLKLSGREGWRIRVGNYQVVDQVDDKRQVLTAINIGRRDIYS